ncbi:hypothetical protein NM688_g3517 [Phlebia brevispora]|uniref:Uncharacterized protein n=1 Tax=Phlebia brevispora TaxID=194682 RepID=A0ACC1T5J3_9APHY|nr:hypothetical protein NM688_g3517 [Phlebia brevispora]
MSATTSDSAIIAEYESDLVFNYVVFSALTMISYEYLVTFRYEVEFIWRRRWSTATWLFLTNRCRNSALLNVMDFLLELPVVVVAIFSTLRVFALLGHKYIPAAFTFLLGIAPLGLNLYQESKSTHYYVDDPVLVRYLSFSHMISRLCDLCSTSLASAVCTIAVDVIAIVTTWIKTHHHVREASAIGINVGVSSTLLRHGTLYFLVLLASNIGQAICMLPLYQNSYAQQVTVFLLLLPNIVLSRFMINLRQEDSAEPGDATHLSASYTLPFGQQSDFRISTLHNIVGNLGEMLADGEEDHYDDEVTNSETSQSSGDEASSFKVDEGTPAVLSIGACEIREVRTATVFGLFFV